MEKYKVIIGSSCPKQGSDPVRFKSFAPGADFIGTLDETNNPPVIRDAEGYVILKSNVYPAADMPEMPGSTDQHSATASSEPAKKLPPDVQAELDKTIKKDFIGDIAELSKGATTGAMIGAVVGILVGLYYGKNILMTGFAGLALGGIVGRNYNKSNDQEKVKLTTQLNDTK